jgi:hypothetical protein
LNLNFELRSSEFARNVIDLVCMSLACKEDKAYEIESWPRLLKAATWEEQIYDKQRSNMEPDR